MSQIALWHNSHEKQRLTYRVVPAPGRPMMLSSVGGQLVALAKALEAAGRSCNPKGQERCFLGGITMDEDGAISFDVIVAPKAPASGIETGGEAAERLSAKHESPARGAGTP